MTGDQREILELAYASLDGYITYPGCHDYDDVMALVSSGLMREGRDIGKGVRAYTVTAAGRRDVFAPAHSRKG